MNAKLISIFTVAGVVAAGSTAVAMNAQVMKNPVQHSVGTSAVDQTGASQEISNSELNPAQDEGLQQTADPTDTSINAVMPATDGTQANSNDNPNRLSQQNQNPDSNSGTDLDTPSPEPTSSLPTVPPNFKPGQDDEDEDEYEDDSDYEHEDSDHEYEWEHEDD